MRSTTAVVDRYFEQLNANDFDGLAELFAPSAVLQVPLTRDRKGRDDIMDYYRGVLTKYPEHHDEPVRALVEGGVAMVEIAYRSTYEDGRTVAFDAVDVFEVSDGEITRLATYFDSERVARQLRKEPT